MNTTFIIARLPSVKGRPASGETETGARQGTVAGFAKRCWRAYCRWDDRLRQRRRLGGLDDHLLADIGVNRSDARREASRWFFV